MKSYNKKKSEGSSFHWFAETYIAGFQGATFLVARTPKKLPGATQHLNWLHLIKRMYRNIFFNKHQLDVYLHINIFSVDYSYTFIFSYISSLCFFIIIFEVDNLFEFVEQQQLRLMQFCVPCAVIQNN